MRYEYIVIAHILENPKSIPIALEKVKFDYFTNKNLRKFYKFICTSAAKRNLVTFNVLSHVLKRKKMKHDIYETFGELSNYKGRKIDEFNYSLNQLKNEYKKNLLIDGVTKASQRLIKDSVKDAEKDINDLILNLERLKSNDNGLVLSLREDVKSSFKLYEKTELEDEEDNRILTGFNFIDGITGGGKPGELWIWGGYTGCGKSQFAKEIAYNNIVEGKNVLFISLEMSVQEMKWLFETRHSHVIKPGGLFYKHIEMGMLSKDDKISYVKTLKDWNKGKYGQLVVWSPEYGCTLDSVRRKIELVNMEVPLDMVIIDYLELLKLDENIKSDERTKVTYKCQAMKDIARTFNDNKGIFIFSPHQISRHGFANAEKRGYHILQDLAESSGVERTANLVGWCLRTEDLKEEQKIRIGISKYRSGDINQQGVEIMADFAHSMITEIDEIQEIEL